MLYEISAIVLTAVCGLRKRLNCLKILEFFRESKGEAVKSESKCVLKKFSYVFCFLTNSQYDRYQHVRKG